MVRGLGFYFEINTTMLFYMICNTGIYLITHIATGRPYVGLVGRKGGFESRWKQEILVLNKNLGSGHLQNAWNKYGRTAFSFSVHTYIAQGKLTSEEFYLFLRKEEARILKLFPKHLNSTKAGEHGMLHTEEAKEKIRKASQNYMRRPENRARSSRTHKGKKLSQETKNKIAAAKTGIKQSPEVIKKRTEKQIGSKRSEETKAKIKASLNKPEVKARLRASLIGNTRTLGHKLTKEHKEKIGKSSKGRKPMLGKHHSDKFKKEMSLRMKGNQHGIGHTRSPEHRAKISAAQTKIWAERRKNKLTVNKIP